jgi:hypothetical protein
LGRDIGAQEAAALPVDAGDGTVIDDDGPRHARQRSAFGQDHWRAALPGIKHDVRQTRQRAVLDARIPRQNGLDRGEARMVVKGYFDSVYSLEIAAIEGW